MNKAAINAYHALLVISTAVFAVTYWLPSFEGFYSQDILTLRQWDGWGAWLPPLPFLNLCLFAAGIVIPVLMFCFVSWARPIFLLYVVVYALISLGWGVRVSTPAEVLSAHFIALCDGAILALAYLPPIAGRFSSASAEK